jgi:anti-sigma factor RsiW
VTDSRHACQRVGILLGVLVLGGLSGQEELLVRTHLAGCPRCQAEYEELAEVPALLDLLTPEEAAHAGDAVDSAVPGSPGSWQPGFVPINGNLTQLADAFRSDPRLRMTTDGEQ